MRKTEVYQIRLDTQEKHQAFEVFRQLGLTPAQAIRLFFKQVVLTQSIPFQIEHKSSITLLSHNLRHPQQDHHEMFAGLDSMRERKNK